MRAILVLGTNSGERQKNIEAAIDWLRSVGKIIHRSSYYETPDCYGNGPGYGNAVVDIEFKGSPDELNTRIKNYEILCGRDETSRRDKRVPIDIDIVSVNGTILRPRDFNAYYFKKGYSEIIPVLKLG